MTDEEILAAYRSFIAKTGRYRLEGDQLIREAYMVKDPDYMAAWPDNDAPWTVAMDGDRLTITFNTPNGNTIATTWRRPKGDDGVVR